jgi:hypothetical protein
MAIGSLAELDTQLEIARRLRLVPEAQLTSICDLIATLRSVLHEALSLESAHQYCTPNPPSLIPDPHP